MYIDEVSVYLRSTNALGTWRMRGSHDKIQWEQIGNDFVLGSGNVKVATLNPISQIAYRYFQLYNVSGGQGSSLN